RVHDQSCVFVFFFSSRRRHTRCYRDWSSDVCSSDLERDRPGRLAQLWTVMTYLGSNAVRLVTGRLKRYGRAAVNFGTPISLREWLASAPGVLRLPKEQRLPQLERLAALLMERIGAIIPV